MHAVHLIGEQAMGFMAVAAHLVIMVHADLLVDRHIGVAAEVLHDDAAHQEGGYTNDADERSKREVEPDLADAHASWDLAPSESSLFPACTASGGGRGRVWGWTRGKEAVRCVDR